MVASIMLGQSNFPIDSYPSSGYRETPVAALCSSSSKKWSTQSAIDNALLRCRSPPWALCGHQ